MKYLKVSEDDVYDLSYLLENSGFKDLYWRVEKLKDAFRQSPEKLTCEKHPKYKAPRKPSSSCAKCWRIYHHFAIERKLKASWKE